MSEVFISALPFVRLRLLGKQKSMENQMNSKPVFIGGSPVH